MRRSRFSKSCWTSSRLSFRGSVRRSGAVSFGRAAPDFSLPGDFFVRKLGRKTKGFWKRKRKVYLCIRNARRRDARALRQTHRTRLRSSMDRISDSGSDDMGSNPVGVTHSQEVPPLVIERRNFFIVWVRSVGGQGEFEIWARGQRVGLRWLSDTQYRSVLPGSPGRCPRRAVSGGSKLDRARPLK